MGYFQVNYDRRVFIRLATEVRGSDPIIGTSYLQSALLKRQK